MLRDLFSINRLSNAVRSPYKNVARASLIQQDIVTGVFRAAAAGNRIPSGFQTIGSDSTPMRQLGRYRFVIGSADFSELRAVFNNWYIWTTGVFNTGNSQKVVNLFLESENLNTSVRVTFNNGNSELDMAAGAMDIMSDAILPSAFGLTKFTRGEYYRWRIEVEVPQGASSKIVVTQAGANDYSGGGSHFDPTVTHISNLGGTGNITTTGAAPIFTATGGYRPLCVGKMVIGDARTVLGVGDSIMMGVTSGTGNPSGSGLGFFGLMCHNGGNPIACINCGLSGGFTGTWSSTQSGGALITRPELNALIKYCSDMVEEYGTNDFDNTGNLTNAQVDQKLNVIKVGYAYFRTIALAGQGISPFRIHRTKLLPRTLVPTGDTPADQTVYGDKWTIAGSVIRFNDTTQSWVSDQTIDNYINFDIVARYSPSGNPNSDINYHKWLNGFSSAKDGTHPSYQLHSDMAVQLKLQAGL